MNYPDSFKTLVFDDKCPDFIGWGNPNANILLLGKEPAIDMDTEHGKLQYKTEVTRNKQDWQNNIINQNGFKEIFDKHSHEQLYGNPLWPHCWQKYRVKKRKGGILPPGDGTSRTWYQYQKLIDMIIGRESVRNSILDFHKYCFSTDLSDYAKLNSRRYSKETDLSVLSRSEMFHQDFFSHFKIVIAAIGNYRHRLDWNKFVDEHFSANHLVVITHQLSAPISDEYLRKTAYKIRDFAKQENIEFIHSPR